RVFSLEQRSTSGREGNVDEFLQVGERVRTPHLSQDTQSEQRAAVIDRARSGDLLGERPDDVRISRSRGDFAPPFLALGRRGGAGPRKKVANRAARVFCGANEPWRRLRWCLREQLARTQPTGIR